MVGDAFLAGFGQVMRHQQDAVRAQALGFLGVFDGHAGRAAGAGQDGYLATAGFHRGADHVRIVLLRQREELARAAGCEQGRGAVRGQPFQAFDIGRWAEIALFVKVGHGERKQAVRNNLLEFLRCSHVAHPDRHMAKMVWFVNGARPVR
ncbi:hypothetical protein D3C86_1604170 [compost metagenome]